MTFQALSSKQRQVLSWCHKKSSRGKYRAIICDGAVRSGKTVAMTVAFLHWAMRFFAGQNFGICGKTVRSTERNIILPLLQNADITGYYEVSYARTLGLLTVKCGGKTNYFYLFGGRDESSYSLIQGITLAGVLFDEVALMPQSFVDQAIARTLSVREAKLWFNCNPENPNHYFYKEWILDADGENKKGSLHLHFLMEDNPILSPEDIKKAETLYSGVFYDRYIKGLWVRAEGVIYRQFADNPERFLVDLSTIEARQRYAKDIRFVTIGVDFGGNRSQTAFVATAVHGEFAKLTVLLDHAIPGKKGEIDVEKVIDELIRFIERLQKHYPGIMISEIRPDSAEQYIINSIRSAFIKKGISIPVLDSIKNEILQRIRCVNTLLTSERLFLSNDCSLVKEGLCNAVWDKEAAERGQDVRLDDFTSDIDILDAFEYSFEKHLRQLTPELFEPVFDRSSHRYYGEETVSSDDFRGGWKG